MLIDGETIIYDLKTGKGVYPEVALQLAAYAHADFILDPDGTERPIPEIQGAAVVHLRPEAYELIPVRVDEEIFEVFKALLAISEWDSTSKKTVLGAVLNK